MAPPGLGSAQVEGIEKAVRETGKSSAAGLSGRAVAGQFDRHGAPAATANQCAEAEPADNQGNNRADSARAAAITDAARGELGDMLRSPRLQLLFVL